MALAARALLTLRSMDQTALHERRKYEQMWTFADYRDDHVTVQARLAFLTQGMRPGDSLIDFGAGAGYASRWFQDAGVRVLAIDIAPNSMAPDIAAHVPLLIGNLWDMPIDITADWGFCCDVMEHIPTDRVDDVLRTVRKSTRGSTFFSIALRPDGCGRLIGDSLHLTVKPLEWWLARVTPHWSDVRVLRHEPGATVDFICS